MDLTLGNLIHEAGDQVAREAAATPAARKKQTVRRFTAARVNRLTHDWVTAPVTANQVLRGDLRRLRERARDLSRNDPYARKILGLYQTNIIGKGLSLQAKFSGRKYATDDDSASLVEKAFKRWGDNAETCTKSGKMNWPQVQRLIIKMIARDGEVLIRKITDPSNPFGFSLKLYGGDWLDETHNTNTANGNRIIMGVEVDQDDKPVAFHICPPVSDYMYQRTRKRQRIPASQMMHAFVLSEDEEQTRGVPWLHAAMLRLKMLDGYEEAELVSARVDACNMGFFIPPEDENQTTHAEDEFGNEIIPIEEAEPGIFSSLPAGYKVEKFDPKNPNANAPGFKKSALRGVAAGSDISYHSIANDLESVNYSSARIGSLEDRDFYEVAQEFFIDFVAAPIFKAWFKNAFMMGAVEINLRDVPRIYPDFSGRGWQWVDPKKDAEAAVIALQNNMTTLTDVLAEKRIDLEDFLKTLKSERELAEKYGIKLEYNNQIIVGNEPPEKEE